MTVSPENSVCQVQTTSAIYIAEQFLKSDWYSKQLGQLRNDLMDAKDDDYLRASVLYEFTTLMQEVFLTWSNVMGECCADIGALKSIK